MPADEEATRPRYGLHVGLFLVTCVTTYLAGGSWHFAATLMTILLCHEMGHFVVARRHGLDVSLPYFVPLPPVVGLGTLGAVIRMRRPIERRDHLIDVGAAGPLAGLAVALPLLGLGLWLSPVEHPQAGGLVEGNSLAYLALKLAVKGQILPGADGSDVTLHPVAFAAWVGLLITFINLMPIGQLDGGHIAAAYLGDSHEKMSRLLHRALPIVGVAVAIALAADARVAERSWLDAIEYGAWGASPWLVWTAMLLVLRRVSGGRYHPPVEGAPLTGRRRVLAFAMVGVFALLFTPVPLRESLLP
jgi:membrane-associated protease RseP (regulator of RpoE activity)